MSLEKAYINNVRSSRRIVGGPFGLPPIERDPTIAQLEKDLFSKIKEISPKEEIKTVTNISSISVEDAIKELIQIYKNDSIRDK